MHEDFRESGLVIFSSGERVIHRRYGGYCLASVVQDFLITFTTFSIQPDRTAHDLAPQIIPHALVLGVMTFAGSANASAYAGKVIYPARRSERSRLTCA